MSTGRPHPDPLGEKLLAEDSQLADEYERLGPRFEFATAVIRARKDKDWTQTDLARAIGTTQSAIARLESGDHDPKLSTMIAVCRALRIPLLEGIDSEYRTAS